MGALVENEPWVEAGCGGSAETALRRGRGDDRSSPLEPEEPPSPLAPHLVRLDVRLRETLAGAKREARAAGSERKGERATRRAEEAVGRGKTDGAEQGCMGKHAQGMGG